MGNLIGIQTALCLVSMLGVASAEGTPRLMDTVGVYETELRAYIAPNAKPAWVPEYKFVVEFDGYAQEDVVLVQWKQGGTAIGKPFACGATAHAKDAQLNPTQQVYPVNMAYYDCRHPNEAAITKAGTFTLELTYKQTLANKLTPLGTLEMKVIELKQGSQNKQIPTWTVSHDHRVGFATIEENMQRSREAAYDLQQIALLHNEAARKVKQGGAPHYTIRVWTKYKQGGPTNLSMACLLDGKRVVEARHTGGENRDYWTFQGKDRETGKWSQQEFQFYKSRAYKEAEGATTPDVWVFGDHPGDYTCVATAGGETVAEVMFTVGPDGAIVDTPCQAQVATVRHVHVAKLKPGKLSNTNVDAGASKKAFFGHVVWKKGCPN